MSIRALAGAAVGVTFLLALAAEAPIDANRSSDAAEASTDTEPEREVRRIELGGVRVRLDDDTRQVVTVNHKRGHRARVTAWRNRGHGWKRVRTTRHGHIGYGGLVPGPKRKQGTGTTPIGTYTMKRAFGIARAPKRAKLPFHRVHKGDYWVQDNKSRFYNQRRHKSAGGFRWWLPSSAYNSSERLRDYRGQYAWAIVIDFNRPDPVRHRGSGIFLHVNGDGATAGCVSAPRKFIRKTLAGLRPGRDPVIAIGR
ncbi:L,D-transpeptidase family protein [Solicola gregarius]|uniref:L,D-TPase catalytic domain-containing protein n=1 Tax=Solicola gregarius TaxID=2908642 RepID=A0AA46YLR2_9ACTN|nr:L,D-transpeptidase family protein [Solicola gregarius]UYM07215.1 hypothetical protein L0C25_09105 [Solicola gregarius]